MAAPYQYRPLKKSEIRILHVKKVTTSDVFCSLIHQSLPPDPDGRYLSRRKTGLWSRTPLYATLSYTWGSPEKPHIITVDGKALPVTENVWLAIRRLYGIHINMFRFWIDAICINQLDIPERNQQVQRMGDIYANTLFTIIWLGEATEDFKIVRKFLKLLFWWIMRRRSSLWDLSTGLGFEKPSISRNKVKEELDNFFDRWQRRHDKPGAIWSALTGFLQRPWFRRMWVIQEVVLAPHVRMRVGAYSLTAYHCVIALKAVAAHLEHHPDLLDDVEARSALRAIDFIYRITMLQQQVFSRYRIARLLRKSDGPTTTAARLRRLRLEILIGHSLPAKASDLRDRVYALLAIASQGNESQFQVDYTSAPKEVYAKLARFYLVDRKSPLMLSLAGTEIHGWEWSRDQPSWVPDLSQSSTHDMPPQSMVASLADYHCETNMEFNARVTDDNVLVLKAFMWSSISQVVKFPSQYELSESDAWFRDCEALSGIEDPSDSTAKGKFDKTLYQTLIWDRSKSDLYSSYHAFRRMCKTAADGQNPIDETDTEAAYEFLLRFRSIGYGTRKAIMRATSGCLVSGPLATQVGDRICVIAGARVPFIFRQNVGEETGRIVGECCVSSLMYKQVDKLGTFQYFDIKIS